MSSARSLWDAFFVMIICFLIAIILLFAIGMPLDIMLPVFTDAGFENVNIKWDTFDDRDFVVDIVYFIDYALIFIGVTNFLASAVRRQEYDTQDLYYQQ